MKLPDVQSESDQRGIPLVVTVKSVHKRIILRSQTGKDQHVDAVFTMSAHLSCYSRGAHMSRFLRALRVVRKASPILPALVAQLRQSMDTAIARARMDFLYRVDRTSPESGIPFEVYIPAFLEYESVGTTGVTTSGVTVPVMTVCPCSLELSGGVAAHSQRCDVSVVAESSAPNTVWLESLVDSVRGSAPVFSVLRREDEKRVVDDGFSNPMFVEDVVRATLEASIRRVGQLARRVEVTATSYESIHPHNVEAMAEWVAHEDKDKTEGEAQRGEA